MRVDDCLGRFDGSRFVLLLRRVDAELGSLIVGQLLSRLQALCGEELRWGGGVRMRCGLTGSGKQTPDLTALTSRALTHLESARRGGVDFVSDLTPVAAGAAP